MTISKTFIVAVALAGILSVNAASAETMRPPIQAAIAKNDQPSSGSKGKMLILPGIAGPGEEGKLGQLDRGSATEYAKRLGYEPIVLNIPGATGANSPQVKAALQQISNDSDIKAIYGFSGGGYNAAHIFEQLSPAQRQQIEKIHVLGAPGIDKSRFSGVVVSLYGNPREGHLAGPAALLASTLILVVRE